MCPPSLRLPCAVIFLFANATALSGAAAQATSRIAGDKDELSIELENARVSDVLTQLSQRHGFAFKTLMPLTDTVSGHWQGSLRSIIDRLLRNNHYVVRHSSSDMALIVYGASGSAVNFPLSQMESAASNIVPPQPPATAGPRMIPNPPGAANSRYLHKQP